MGRVLVTLAIVAAIPAAQTSVAAGTPMVFANEFAKYPGYTGVLNMGGTVSIAAGSTDGEQVLLWDLSGLDTACVAGASNGSKNECGIHVHSGTSCATHDEVKGHYYSTSADPWIVVYVSDASGRSVGRTNIVTGLSVSEFAGRAFVIHGLQNGIRVACGILGVTPQVATSGFSKYPGYTGNLAVSGSVTMSQATGKKQVLTWALSGLDLTCTPGAGSNITNACGIHVHKGTSCANHEAVGGHYYGTAGDPWIVVYQADSSGKSGGTVTVDTGVSLSDLEGKAFVVHELANGGRVACGILEKLGALSAPTFHAYPGYQGSISVSGIVTIEGTSTAKEQRLVWDLSGLDTTCIAGAANGSKNECGIHVHKGTSCASHEAVQGHYYGAETDPWIVMYEANGLGKAAGQATISTGLSVEDMVGRAFVVHQLANGGRVACGILFPAVATKSDSLVSSAISSGASLGALGLAAAYMLS